VAYNSCYGSDQTRNRHPHSERSEDSEEEEPVFMGPHECISGDIE
jgi:hypothetical protein